MPPAARVGDMHVCPMVEPGPVPHVGGPILPAGEPTVLIGFMPAAREGDQAVCVGPPDSIAMGTSSVLIGNKPAARLGDPTSHGGSITIGCPTVMIGASGSGGAGGGGGGSEEAPGAGSVAGAEASDVSAQIGALQAAAAAGMAFVQQCVKQPAAPPPKPALQPGAKPIPQPEGKSSPKPGPIANAQSTSSGGAPAAAKPTPLPSPVPVEDFAPPADEATKKTITWIKFQVVDAETGNPIESVAIKVKKPDGAIYKYTTNSNGVVEINDIAPGSCEASCELKDVGYNNILEFVGMADSDAQSSAQTPKKEQDEDESQQASTTYLIAEVERHKVKTGESIASLAKGAGITWQELAKFNWDTDVPKEINEHLVNDIGCTKKTADGKNLMFDDSDDPGLVRIPKKWLQEGLDTGRTHVIAVIFPHTTPPWLFSI